MISESPSVSSKLKIEAIFTPHNSVGFALTWVVEESGVPELGLESFPSRKPAHASKGRAAKVLKGHVNPKTGGKKQSLSWGRGGLLGRRVPPLPRPPPSGVGTTPSPGLLLLQVASHSLLPEGPAESVFLDFSFQKAHSFPGELSLRSLRITVLMRLEQEERRWAHGEASPSAQCDSLPFT